MFNLNEDNRIVMAQHPTDMRMGVNGMCGRSGKWVWIRLMVTCIYLWASLARP